MGATGRRLGSGQVSLGGLGLRSGGSYWPMSFHSIVHREPAVMSIVAIVHRKPAVISVVAIVHREPAVISVVTIVHREPYESGEDAECHRAVCV